MFPLRKKFYEANVDVDALEADLRGEVNTTVFPDYSGISPALSPEDVATIEAARSTSYEIGAPELDFKYSESGKKLPVTPDGTWIRRVKDWRPWQVPIVLWRGLNPEQRERERG